MRLNAPRLLALPPPAPPPPPRGAAWRARRACAGAQPVRLGQRGAPGALQRRRSRVARALPRLRDAAAAAGRRRRAQRRGAEREAQRGACRYRCAGAAARMAHACAAETGAARAWSGRAGVCVRTTDGDVSALWFSVRSKTTASAQVSSQSPARRRMEAFIFHQHHAGAWSPPCPLQSASPSLCAESALLSVEPERFWRLETAAAAAAAEDQSWGQA